MSQPFVCSGCRLKLAIRARAAPRSLSAVHTRSFSDSDGPDPSFRDRSENPGRPSRYGWERVEHQGTRQAQRQRDPQPAPIAGRYSGQALKPQQLLGQIDDYEPRGSRRSGQSDSQRLGPGRFLKHTAQYSDRDGPHRERTSSLAARSVPERQSSLGHINSLVDPFIQAVDAREISGSWDALQRIKDGLTLKEIKSICNPRHPFQRKLAQLMRRIDSAYLRRLQIIRVDSPKDPRRHWLTPWDFAKLTKEMGCLLPWLRTEMLWRLGKGLMAARIREEYKIPQEADYEVCNQIVLLWHDALGARLWQDDGSTKVASDIANLDWSGLPPPHVIASVERGSETTLPDVLSKIVPLFNKREDYNFLADYQSTMIMTLDVLKGGGKRSSTVHEPDLAPADVATPLINFFDDVLKRVAKPKVPHTLRRHIELSGDPTLAYYESLVRRFDLKDIPPLRIERGKVTMETPHEKTSAFGADGDKIEMQGDAITSPSEKIAPTSIKHDLDQEQISASDGTHEDGVGQPPVALDKESLLEAGFSVAESWDMSPEIHKKVDAWLKRIGRSIEQTNLSLTETCWREVNDFNTSNAGTSSLPLYLYEHFMLAFLAMRQPRLAVETWGTVSKVGLKPTVRTWTVMMRGCSRAGDIITLETFWARMRAQNVQPDQHAWSVRVYGLIAEKRIDAALDALNAMGQEWLTAIRGDLPSDHPRGKHGKTQTSAVDTMPDLSLYPGSVNGIPRPGLVVMNSAISALARKDDTCIPRVLSWGRTFAIEPDLTTYNALLNVAMRHSQPVEALAIFKRMQDRGILPDSTTFTVLLTALFQSGFLNNMTQPQQTEKLLALISSIESASPDAQMDAKAYALAIDRMLKLHSNAPAARALLSHMAERGIEPTAHIYTILMTSYFSSSPPDFGAVEALWQRIRSANSGYGAPVDVIFYDRMVENYATHHAAVGMQPSLSFLERMSKEGKRPSWRALECVARALAERGEWARLRALVGDLIHLKGSVRLGARGLVGQREFWGFVIGTGVVRAEEVREGAVTVRATSSWRGEQGEERVV